MSLLRTDADLARHSYYAATSPSPAPHEALQEDLDCDVAIVGGGLAGLSAAIELAERGHRVALLEAREIGSGASGRNGGQAIVGLACDIETIEAQLGLDEARRVWAMTQEALDLIGERSLRFNIDCDWQSGYLYLALSERKARALREWNERLEKLYGHDARWIDARDVPQWIASPRYRGATYEARSGHLHPLKYTRGLARAAARLGVRIFEHSPATALEPGAPLRLRTAQGSLRARQVLLAGNVYLQQLAPALEPRIMPVGTYIVSSQALDPALAQSLIPSQAAACDTNFVLDYFRPAVERQHPIHGSAPEHRMVYGGRVSYSTATPANLVESMRRRMVQTFPQLHDVQVEHAWGGFVDITMNRAPDFGRLSDRLAGRSSGVGLPDGNAASSATATSSDSAGRGYEQVYYLQGFSGHGLALTGLAGRLVAEAIDGDARRFDVFARLRHRPFPGGRLLRTPALVLGMAYYRLRDLL